MPTQFAFEVDLSTLDVALCVTSGQVFRWTREGDSWLGVDGSNWYLVRQDEHKITVDTNANRQAFERLFRLDWDVNETRAKLIERGPELEPYLGELAGLRMMRPTCPHEVLFGFLCSANNHLARIGKMVQKLSAYGEPLCRVGSNYLTEFPSVERIATIPEQELRQKGFGYRSRTIVLVARQMLKRGDGWLEGLRDRPYEEIRTELTSLTSIGPKLADCIALYGLDKTEATPIDTHLWQAVCRVYFPEWQGTPLTERKYRQAGDFLRERFGDLAGVAHQYLFYENLQNWRKRKQSAKT